MLRIIFIVLIIFHGLIHLLGFLKAFEFAKINQLSQPITKTVGLIWLFVGLLFGVALIAFLLKKELWWLLAFVAVVFSQLLIFLHWQDAKFGSIANAIILLVCLSGYGGWNFDKMVRTELNSFLPKSPGTSQIIAENSISHLPETVQLWLKNSHVIGKSGAATAHLHQSGRMKIKPNGAWMDVKAEQWFTIETPGFIWNADVGKGSFIQFSGRDRLEKGKGSMLIKLFSLIPIVDAEGISIDQGVMVRYLSEIIWFPSAALSEYIVWEEISPTKVRAILTYNYIRVDGIFTFNDKGQPSKFEAKRYYDQTQKLEPWLIDIDPESFKSFNDIAIPTKATVTWKLESGDFTWYEVEINEREEN